MTSIVLKVALPKFKSQFTNLRFAKKNDERSPVRMQKLPKARWWVSGCV